MIARITAALVFCLTLTSLGVAELSESEVIALYRQAQAWIAAGKYASAARTYRQILPDTARIRGEGSFQHTGFLLAPTTLDSETGRPAQGEPLFRQCPALRETRMGRNHPHVANVLNNYALMPVGNRVLAALFATPVLLSAVGWAAPPTEEEVIARYRRANELVAAGKFTEAEPLFQSVVKEGPRFWGAAAPEQGFALDGLAGVQHRLGRYESAEANFKQGLLILEKALGKDALETSTLVSNLATLYQNLGRYEEAEPLVRRALAISEAKLPREHPDRATALLNLAALLHQMGRYTEAGPLYQGSVASLEAGLGKNHPAVANALTNWALFHRETGKFEPAETLYRRAIAILEQQGKDRLDVARALANLGALLKASGRYEQAEVALRRALEIRETRLGKDHPDVAHVLHEQALLSRDRKQHQEGERLLRRALEIFETRLGKTHPSVGTARNSLALLYHDAGQVERARAEYLRVLELSEARLGKDHPALAVYLNNLAGLERRAREFDEAERLYRRSLQLIEARLGPSHPNLVTALNNLGLLYQNAGRIEDSAKAFDRARRAVYEHNVRVLPGLGEREQLEFLTRTDAAGLHGALALALLHPNREQLADRAAEWLLNARGISHRCRSQSLLAARDARDPRMSQDLRELLDLRRRQARLSMTGPVGETMEAHRRRLQELRDLEQEHLTRLQRLGADVGIPPWTERSAVQRAIPEQAVLVEWIRFHPFDFAQDTPGEPRYLAALMRREGSARLIDLGPAKTIDDAVAQVRSALGKAPAVLRAEGEIAAEKALREPLTALAQRVLVPIRPHLDRADRWIFSPDAALWLVPWAALPLDEKTTLIEKHALQLVVSGRDLLPRSAPADRASAPLLVADPDFDGELAAPPGSLRGLSDELKLGRITRLPGTAAEAEAIAPLMSKVFGGEPVQITEARAMPAAVLTARRPRSLVLATHGFFLPEAETTTSPTEDPLLRCGLLLAGCNRPGDAGRAGVLTGREVLSVDLRGCELVILSACETGLGDVRQGEGVAGLRQAFQLAGAESVLASLWKVPDDETTLQMVAFMEALSKGKDRVEALAIAQRQRISARREKFGAAHPFNWAAFTLTGSAGGQR